MAKMGWEAAKREMNLCVICECEIDWQYTSEGEVYWKHGHNAQPVAEGQCCSLCNEHEVIPARIEDMLEAHLKPEVE